MTSVEAISTLGGVSGVVALAGALVGYGRLQQRLNTVERDLAKLSELSDKVTRIDERTKNTDENVRELKGSMQELTSALLQSVAPHIPGARARG